MYTISPASTWANDIPHCPLGFEPSDGLGYSPISTNGLMLDFMIRYSSLL